MTIIKPKKLKKGDTIGILAVSGEIKDYNKIENAKKFLEKEGYNVIVSESCKYSHRYLAGKTDDYCVNELHNFFENNEIDAILCARGGYGTLRLINKIDWNIIKNNPKIFVGYSDISILLNLITQKTGLITFHGPMANGDFGDEINNYTKEEFFNTLSGLTTVIEGTDSKIFYGGSTTGILWGGNLSSIASLCGTDFIPNNDIILLLEDLNEPVYKIDKMITQLLNIKEFKNRIKGIALGEFKNIPDTDMLNELFEEIADFLKIPICNGFKITHNKEKNTIPIGVEAIFNANIAQITIKTEYLT